MNKCILSSDAGKWKAVCIPERHRREERCGQGAVFDLEKMAYVEVRSAGSWESGHKRTDGPDQIETECN